MASNDDIQKLIQQIADGAQVDKNDPKLTWLANYLNNLPADQQDTAFKKVQDVVSSGNYTNLDDINWNAQQGAGGGAGKDPVSALRVTSSGGVFGGAIPGGGVKTRSEGELQQVRDYFAKENIDADTQKKIIQQIATGGNTSALIDQAKAVHWSLMAPEERAKNPQPGEVQSVDQLLADVDVRGDTKQLKDFIARLDPTTRYSVLQALTGSTQKKFGAMPGEKATVSVGDLMSEAHRQVSASKARVDQAAQTAAAASATGATGAGTTPSSQDILNIQAGATDVSDYQKQAYKALTGQDFDTAYNAFTKSYAVGVQQYNTQTQRMQGGEQLWTSGGFQAPDASKNFRFGAAVPLSQAPAGKDYKITAGQFLGMQSQTYLQAAQQIETAANQDWLSEYGSPMPDDLRLLLFQEIGKMKPEDLYALQSTGGSTGQPYSALLQSGPIASVITSYKAAHPVLASSDAALHKSLDAKFQAATGAPATTEDIAALRGADEITMQRYIDNKLSDVPGMTAGTKADAMSNMKQLWVDNFGHQPTNDELRKFAGWNKDDITRWVDSQPSKDNPGLTIGQRTGYISMADDVSQKWWATPADSRMVGMLNQHFGATGDASTKEKAASDYLAKPGAVP